MERSFWSFDTFNERSSLPFCSIIRCILGNRFRQKSSRKKDLCSTGMERILEIYIARLSNLLEKRVLGTWSKNSYKVFFKFIFEILSLTYSTKELLLYKKLAFIIILDMSGILGDGIMRFSMILIIVMCLIQVLLKDGQLNDVWNEIILLQPLSEITKW